MTRKLLFGNIAACSIATGLMAAAFVHGDYWLAGACGIAALVALLNVLVAPYAAERLFHLGWLNGRQALFESMSEAMRRDMTMPEWIVAELERDGVECVHFVFEADEE